VLFSFVFLPPDPVLHMPDPLSDGVVNVELVTHYSYHGFEGYPSARIEHLVKGCRDLVVIGIGRVTVEQIVEFVQLVHYHICLGTADERSFFIIVKY